MNLIACRKALPFPPKKRCSTLSKTLLVMKLTVVFFFAACMQLSARTAAQNVSLSERDVSLSKVISKIKKQVDYSFFYDADLLRKSRPVSIDVKNISLSEALALIFENQPLTYEIIGRIITLKEKEVARKPLMDLTPPPPPPADTVRGKVKDDKGQPVAGATVTVSGSTSRSVSTDENGDYSIITGDADATISFSYIGYQRVSQPVANAKLINITLKADVVQMNDVVVVGYGTQRKSDLTGAVASANIDAFRESPNVSIMESLQGSVPGLNIGQVNSAGQNPSISIRGLNSFDASNGAPLIVLDGIIYKGSIVDLNPNDVASIDILKDASSTAIYGSRAANGVVLITTRKGKTGKPVFNYNGSYSIEAPAKTLDFINRDEYIQKTRDALWDQAYTGPDYLTPNPSFNPSTYWNVPIREGFDAGTFFDWWKAATQTGHVQSHNLSMSGKNERTTYYISAGLTDQLGYIINDKYKRYSFRMNIENEIKKWFKVGVQSNITLSDFSGIVPAMADILRMSPLTEPYDANGELILNPYGANVPNPFFDSNIDELSKQLNLWGNVYAVIDVPFVKGLSYRFNYSHNYRNNRQFQFNRYGNNYLGSASKMNATQYDWTFDNILTYNRTFGSHSVNATLVSGREESTYESSLMTANTFSNMDLGYNRMDVAANQFTTTSAWDESSLYYMARLNYDYRKKYFATITVRRDGFSGFSEKHKYGTFPSAAVAWTLSEEDFIKDKISFINFLKLRASYGVNGNRTLGRYGTLARVVAGQNYIFGDNAAPTVGQSITTLANDELTWETTVGLNLGLDFRFLKNRISGTIDYYNSNTHDILYAINIPTVTGFSTITSNIGKVHNSGIELTLNARVIDGKDFSWDLGFNFSRNRNKIVSIIGDDKDGDGKEDDLVASSLFIGQPLGSIYGFAIDGIYQIGETLPAGYRPGQYKIKDLNHDNLITAALDREILGYSDPSYRFGVSNTVQYKQWTLRAFINSIQGGSKYYYAANEPGSSWGYNDAVTSGNLVKYDYWTPSNPGAQYAQLYYPTPNNPVSYRQRSFVRLQDISLSYQVSQNLIKRLGLSNLKVFVSGKNLATWTNWEGWDPETGQGISRTGRPVLKSVAFGIDLSF